MRARAKRRAGARKADGSGTEKRPRIRKAPASKYRNNPTSKLSAALAFAPSTSMTVAELATALGWTFERTSTNVERYARAGRVERWRDPDSPGQVRVMLAASTAERLGLALSAKGDRWIEKAG